MRDLEDINVELKTIAKLQMEKVNFYIDSYQRGYRWSRNEVYNLLEDIREFNQNVDYKGKNGNSDKFYCLQPIIVTQNENNDWKVIDGQQRLTTLYLIYSFYNKNLSSNLLKSVLPFNLRYKGKKILEECLTELANGNFATEKDYELLNRYMYDIDCYFVIEAYKEISKYFINLYSNMELQSQVNEMKSVFDNYMKVIWYELKNCDSQKEINMFTKINMGKIPLTNSELIKALLLKKEDEDKDFMAFQENIAIKWDEIEAKLLDDDFFSFLANKKYKDLNPRIDFIFEIMAYELNENILKGELNNNESYYIERKYNSSYFSFYVINNYMKYFIDKGKKRKDIIKDIWEKIFEYYNMFNDWYYNRTWYHLIGYNIYTAENDNIEKIYELSQIYRNSAGHEYGHKTYFQMKLKEMTKNSLLVKKEKLDELIGNLSYKDDGKIIRRVLLIYNIAVLEVEEKTNVRFAFEKFKKDSWDIEHINATADNRPYDNNDTETNESLQWLISALNLENIDEIYIDGKKIKDSINRIIEKKLYLPKNNDSEFIDVYEKIINYFNDLTTPNGIGNLTLLDSAINRGYKNDVFPSKRKEIIKKCCSDIYIPLATKKVFLKAYANAKNLLKWTQEDYDNYIDDIIEKISLYLSIKEENDGR